MRRQRIVVGHSEPFACIVPCFGTFNNKKETNCLDEDELDNYHDPGNGVVIVVFHGADGCILAIPPTTWQLGYFVVLPRKTASVLVVYKGGI